MYPDNAVIPTHLSNWDLFLQPIRTDHINCGINTSIGYPDPVVSFGNNAVINPWLGGMYAVLLAVLLVGIPLLSFIKKFKHKFLVTFASLFAGLFIVTNIFMASPYGHLDNWVAWTILVIDSVFVFGTLAAGTFFLIRSKRKVQ